MFVLFILLPRDHHIRLYFHRQNNILQYPHLYSMLTIFSRNILSRCLLLRIERGFHSLMAAIDRLQTKRIRIYFPVRSSRTHEGIN